MEIFTAVQYVGTALTLVAFLAAVAAFAFQQQLKSRADGLLAVPEADRLRATQDTAEYIHVDLNQIPLSDRTKVVIEQLRLKAQRQWQVFMGFMFLTAVIGAATILLVVLRPAQVQAVSVPPPDNGWVWAGYLSRSDAKVWASGPFVDIASYSGATDRPYPIREGDVIRPKKDLPQVIIGWASTQADNVLSAPPKLTHDIDPARDYTGKLLTSTMTYLVMDVAVGGDPGQDLAVWLRVIPGSPDPAHPTLPQAPAAAPPAAPATTSPTLAPQNTSTTLRLCQGEYENACGPHDGYQYCYEDPNKWAASTCQTLGGKALGVARVSSRGGNKCGYDLFTVVCSIPVK